jgi:hypothetical protein
LYLQLFLTIQQFFPHCLWKMKLGEEMEVVKEEIVNMKRDNGPEILQS